MAFRGLTAGVPGFRDGRDVPWAAFEELAQNGVRRKQFLIRLAVRTLCAPQKLERNSRERWSQSRSNSGEFLTLARAARALCRSK